MSRSLFDEIDTDFDDERVVNETDRELFMQMLDNSKIKYTESENEDFEDIVSFRNGVGIAFDEDGQLLQIIKEV